MADWDADSPRLRATLSEVLRQVRDDAKNRVPLTIEAARRWQMDMMAGLSVPRPDYVGKFRGESGLQTCNVRVGDAFGVEASEVAAALDAFGSRLQAVISALDSVYPAGADLNADGLAAVIDFAAWAHCEWVRIHPFANGNGRSARIWANAIFLRYGLPPAIRLRPRPGDGYGEASANAMKGDHAQAARVFRALLRSHLKQGLPKP